MDVDIVNTIHADQNDWKGNIALLKQRTKYLNSTLYISSFFMLNDEEIIPFDFHMGNISVLFLHSALAHVTLVPTKQKNPPSLVIS